MGIRFIRQPSETPNVYNSDDARMIRYAYGNRNGCVIGKGAECEYEIDGSIFKIKSGVLVLQGYEVEIDANGWSQDFFSGSQTNVAIYLEVNLAAQIAEIKSVYQYPGTPVVETGDDLTANTSGVARMLLYLFKQNNGTISSVIKNFQPIKYMQQFVEDLLYYLLLGQDAITVSFAEYATLSTTRPQSDNSTYIATTEYVRTAISTLINNTLKQEEGVITYSNMNSPRGQLIKMGKIVWLNFSGDLTQSTAGTIVATIPSGYRPKKAEKGRGIQERPTAADVVDFTVNTNGQITLDTSSQAQTYTLFSICYLTN